MGAKVIALPFRPKPHQRAAHALMQKARFVVLVWHRRAGKTMFAVATLFLRALQCKRPRGRYGYIAPFLNQAKDIAWQYFLMFAEAIPGSAVRVEELSVTLPNGARIRLYGADYPDRIRGGYFDGVVLDEVGDMRANVWGEIVRPMLADRSGWALFIGTPKGINLFSDLYFAALEGRPDWACDLRRASDTGMIPEEELRQMKLDMSPQEIAQELECDFQAAREERLISLSDVLEAQKREVGRREYEFAPKILGVDVAREPHGDRSVAQPRQGLVARKPEIWRIPDLMDVADQVARIAERWKPDAIFLDYSMGAGVADRLAKLGFGDIVNLVHFGGAALDPRFKNRRAEMWWHMAQWLKNGGCLPRMKEYQAELPAPRWIRKTDTGKAQLEPKEEIKKRLRFSPDVADALALTFAAPVHPRHEQPPEDSWAAKSRHYDYDPFTYAEVS